MKVLIVSHSCAVEINQRIFAELEALTGWSLTLITPENWRDEFGNTHAGERTSSFAGSILQVPVWKNGSIVFHMYRRAWRAWLAREKFDVVYANHEPYALATAQLCLAAWSLPAVFGFYSAQNIVKRYPPPFSWLERAVYRRSAFATPVTSEVAAVLREKGYRGDLEVCPLPFDPNSFHPDAGTPHPTQLGEGGQSVLIGYMGRLVAEKGLLTLAAACGQLTKLDWRLAIIGAGPLEARLREAFVRAGVMDRIIWTGFVPHSESARYLAALDILVVPSETQSNWKEQFGRVVTESLACGTPVIGSDSGEIPNLLRASGGGLIFPERNAGELAHALQALIENHALRVQQGAAGRTWALENLSLPNAARRLGRLIERNVQRVGKEVLRPRGGSKAVD